jgi:TonB-dependent receptor
MKKVSIALLFILTLTNLSLAQEKGTIRGTIYDKAMGQPMYGVTAIIDGTQNGALTDFDGKFEIKVAPGTYTLKASFVSFASIVIENVIVEAGKVVVFDNLQIMEAFTELDEIVVSAEVSKVTEAALLTVKRKSTFLIDGISSANFKRIGDTDAASAAKRVPGVSIEGGKYVYVRGLGDRYTKTILNGMDIPGLDPDRNTLQMDIFPTNVLDNIIVIKSFTPELGADFTGGIVNLETKDFPDEKTFSVSGGLGFNPDMHFNSDYLKYQGGSTDFLGFDDGLRDIPTDGRTDIPFLANALGSSAAAEDYTNILGGFNSNLAAMKEKSFMDFKLGLSTGNQLALGDNTLGYNISLNYKNETLFYEDAEFNRYGKGNNSDIIGLERREHQKGDYGVNSVLLSGMAGLALKTQTSKYRLNLLHLQNGESKAGIFNYSNNDQGANFEAFQHNLEYTQRALTNILFAGTHYINDGLFEVDWRVSPSFSSIEDPDIRFTRIRTDAGGDDFSIGTESGLPERIWRDLKEMNVASKLNLTHTFNFNDTEAKLKFGGAYTYKDRSFVVQNFQFSANGIDVTENPDDILEDSNLWSPENPNGVTYDPLFIPRNTNQYDANVNSSAAYVSAEITPIDKVRAIVGVRAENYVQRYTGEDQTGDFSLENAVVLDDLDFFPSVNVIYNVVENQNLRFSYSNTIARPSLKEASFANIFDPLSGRTFIGGFFPDVDVATGETIWDGDLKSTKISNYDFRWESFQKGGQTFSVSGFYKTFENPIEIVQYVQIANNFQPRNVGDGTILGAEVEARKNLGFISSALDALDFNANVTVIDSQIDMNPTEYQSRVDNARHGETVSSTRAMAGQAPYIINAGLSYQGYDNMLDAGIYYNVQGSTLQFVGIADRPDVFTVPFNSLNVNVSKGFGEDGKMSVSLKVTNLLDSKRELEFESFGAQNQLFSTLDPGRTFKLSFSYKIY